MPEHQKEITERVRGEVKDVAHKVIEEEIRPVVREQITADTLAAIGQMVGLTPRAVAAIEADLDSEDPVIRQRAYTLIMKYTVGHQAIVRPPEEDKSQALTVHFELPRPETPAPVEGAAEVIEEAEVVEDQKECDTCHQMKPESEFIAGSFRCESCFSGFHDKEQELLEQTSPQND